MIQFQNNQMTGTYEVEGRREGIYNMMIEGRRGEMVREAKGTNGKGMEMVS